MPVNRCSNCACGTFSAPLGGVRGYGRERPVNASLSMPQRRAAGGRQLDLFQEEFRFAAPRGESVVALPPDATPPRGARVRCAGTAAQQAFLRELYARLNRARFRGRLPPIPLRLSGRMSNRYGHVIFYRTASGTRTVLELAINLQLLADGNDALLLDTMLHEMAHVEAWLQRGHRGHGATWKRICLRIGCAPRACTQVRPPARSGPVDRVPTLPVLAPVMN